ncbi:MAG: AAA family ATPase [Steroidobacteraceae bacterium]
MRDSKQYKIVELRVEGFKRLMAVTIRPDGNLIQITGKNGHGKSSTLDAIWAAVGGKDACPSMPIRHGQQRARVRLDLGELIVTRTFALAADGDYTTSVAVESPEGARFPSAQRMLDSLLGELTFDPLEFARKKPREQFETLRRFVPDVDFDEIERKNRGDFDRRTEVNRLAKQERGAELSILVTVDTPEEPIDEAALVAQLAKASDTNADIATRRANRERTHAEIERLNAVVASQEERAQEQVNQLIERLSRKVAEYEAEIERIRAKITTAREQCKMEIEGVCMKTAGEALDASNEAKDLQGRLDAAGALPEPVDVAALSQRIETARKANASVRLLQERKKHEQLAEHLEGESERLTAAIEARNADKAAKIAAAAMPVPGVGFGDGIVTLRSVPFSQASSAEQLRASVAIAMALNPRLKVVLIRDGSLLDEDSLELIAKMADESGCQVWCERVDSSGRIGFVIEDGQVKAAPAPAEQPSGAAA